MSGRAWAELIVLSILWGGTFLSVRIALNEIGPLTVVAHRVGWAALLLWGVVFLRRLPVPTTRRVIGAFAIMGLLNNIVPFSLQAWSQLYIESGLTSILNAGTAIWGVLVAALFFKDEKLTLQKSIGVVIGFLGVATAIGIQTLAQLDLRSLAQLAVIASTISYAFAAVVARKLLADVHPIVCAAGMLTASTLLIIPTAAVIEGQMTLSLSLDTWLAIGYYTVFATALAYLLYYRVLAMAGAGNITICTLLIAPIAIVLGTVFLNEALPPQAFLGFGILAVGLIILSRRR